MMIPAHVSALHELVMFDLAHAESDGVDVVLEVVGGHVVQVLRVLVSILDFVPLLRLYVVVVVIVLGIVDGHLEPDHLLGPGGHSVVETYLIVTVHVRLLIVASFRFFNSLVHQFSLWFGRAEPAGDVIDPLGPRALRHLEVKLEILPCCDVGHKEAVIISWLYHHCHLSVRGLALDIRNM